MSDMAWDFMGMHAFWWLFWIALIVVFFALLKPVEGRGRRQISSHELLQDRYAKDLLLQDRYALGEISEKEYEERKAKVEHNSKAGGWKN